MREAQESLSALLDGEVSDFELRRTLEQVDQDPQLGRQWQRYQTARSALKRETIAAPGVDISDRIMAALEVEPSYQPSADQPDAPTTGQRVFKPVSRWWRSVSSMAVAASVTAVVILGAGSINDTTDTGRPTYVLPGASASADLMRTQLGNRSVSPEISNRYDSADVIRLSDGLKRYIDQHQHLLSTQKVPQWTTRWLPEGYSIVRHELLPHGEVMVFANARDAFSVSVEEMGHQSMPEGVAQADGYIAVGKRRGDHFVTVVGDVPLMIADRIASAVQPER
jgi:negative regulator of sigma E activity